MKVVKNGHVYDVHTGNYSIKDIAIEDGKIVEIGENLAGEEIIDATDFYVYPGMVEAHGHIGLDGYGIGFEGNDYNEMGDPVACQLRAIDGIEPRDPALRMAALAGVTTLATGPGSANVLGGTFAAIKTYGNRVDNMVVVPEVAMKCAFGENPKRCYRDKGNSTRMTTAANLRNMLALTKEYLAKKELALSNGDLSKMPPYNQKLEALIPVIQKKIPLKAHAHQANDMFTALRIAKEFDVNITLEHCTEGHLVVDELVKEDVCLAVGPSFGHASKFELRNKTWETPGILANAGCKVSIITDSPVIPEHYLALCAALAFKSGMTYEDAIRAITINPARHLGIEDRVGSIEVGKDADLIICDRDLLDTQNEIYCVLINGEIVDGE